MAVASRLRDASGSSLCASIFEPSIQSSVSRRPVDSSGQTFGTRMAASLCEHRGIERDVLGLADVIELLAQARGDLDRDLGGVDGRIEALADGEQQLQLAEIGFDRRLHVGILQLAGQPAAVERGRLVHLAERSGRRRVMLEACRISSPSRRPVRPACGV